MMSENEKLYLQQMGIATWELTHPERLAGFQFAQIELPAECCLLLVAEQCPKNQTAQLFERVLKSIKLELSQARHVSPAELALVNLEPLTWIWFAGTVAQPVPAMVNVLHSPTLSEIDGNTEHRRALWQQICAYE